MHFFCSGLIDADVMHVDEHCLRLRSRFFVLRADDLRAVLAEEAERCFEFL